MAEALPPAAWARRLDRWTLHHYVSVVEGVLGCPARPLRDASRATVVAFDCRSGRRTALVVEADDASISSADLSAAATRCARVGLDYLIEAAGRVAVEDDLDLATELVRSALKSVVTAAIAADDVLTAVPQPTPDARVDTIIGPSAAFELARRTSGRAARRAAAVARDELLEAPISITDLLESFGQRPLVRQLVGLWYPLWPRYELAFGAVWDLDRKPRDHPAVVAYPDPARVRELLGIS